MKVDVILISGKQGAGKDETFKKLRDFVFKKHPGNEWFVQQMFFAQPIRHIHNVVREFMEDNGNPIPENCLTKDGELMQLIGAWARKRYGIDVWLNIVQNQIRDQIHHTKKLGEELARSGGRQTERLTFVITDCRFRNEFDAFPDTVRVRLEAKEEVRRSRAENWRENTTHESEIDLDGYASEGKFDHVFHTDVLSAQTVAETLYTRLVHGSF